MKKYHLLLIGLMLSASASFAGSLEVVNLSDTNIVYAVNNNPTQCPSGPVSSNMASPLVPVKAPCGPLVSSSIIFYDQAGSKQLCQIDGSLNFSTDALTQIFFTGSMQNYQCYSNS